MNKEEVTHFMIENFDEIQLYILLLNMIEAFIPEDRRKEYLEQCLELFKQSK